MKKIILTISILILTISCSKTSTDEVSTPTTPENLIGTWKFVGYYDDNANEPDGTNYHQYSGSNFLITFNNNGALDLVNDNNIRIGSYTMLTNSSLNCIYDYNFSIPISINALKIDVLTNTVLEVRNSVSTPDDLVINRFEKVTTTQPIAGKK